MFLQETIITTLLLMNIYGECFREVTVDKTISKSRGSTVVLSCPIDVNTCGDLHSVNWFKGEKRIAVVLGNGTNIAAEYRDRLKIEHSPKGPETKITIINLEIKDEDTFTCDTTFFVPQENCDASRGYRINLLVKVAPSDMYILYNKKKITEIETIGPLQEGHELRALCIVESTRPKPKISWHRGDMLLPSQGNYSKEENGIFLYNAEELTFVLSREDLNNDIECRVESDALEKVISYRLKLNLEVRPIKIELKGVEHHTVQNNNVRLDCIVHGARPAANVTWTNSTVLLEDDDRVDIITDIDEEEDGSFTTKSSLEFTATRFENDMDFRCDADNTVMRNNKEKPLHAEVNLEVLFPPVVKVSPSHITVNESDYVLLNCEYIANPASLTSVKWLRDGELVNLNESRFEGGNSENVALGILRTKRDDDGNYTCELSNAIGTTVSETQIDLDVQYVPTVQVQMVPVDQVRENDETNVTLFCNVIDGNPPTLLKVRWYANSSLLKELPDCTETNGDDLCHVDPSKLLLESIGRGFFFNYSCEGFNAAGWGPRSDDKELVVQYEPGPAIIQQDPLMVYKKQSVTLLCLVEDLGFPAATSYTWLRNGQPTQVKRRDQTIELIGLDARGNFTCYAHNSGGKGIPGTHFLNVLAPPTFIKALGQYTGVLYSSKNMSLTCRVECFPKCVIKWAKDGEEIDLKSTDLYHIEEKYLPAEESTGDFESALSILHFNLSTWPNQQFDKHKDSGNYSCWSTPNEAGKGVTSATYLSIEYPPENTTVPLILNVTEGDYPEEFNCTADGNPEPKFVWRYKGQDIILDKKFKLQNPIGRNDSGHYECISHNKHGSHTAQVYVNVQYKPSCEIVRKEIEDEDTLICTGSGNPDDYNYQWYQKTENESIELNGEKRVGKSSHYVLYDDVSITKTYRCLVTNSIGPGSFCFIEVAVKPKRQLTWWQRWDRTTLIILIASIAAILLAVVIICCIIICICRRRRRQEKLHGKSSSLADPLTEPGEYENLPFHGLQTAPNKFMTPINFNNTNVVRVAPRQKLIDNNQQHQLQYQYQQQDALKQATTYSIPSSHHNSLITSKTVNNESDSVGVGSINNSKQYSLSSSNHYNLNECFPTSYTAYYHQQQQRQYCASNFQSGKFYTDYPYTVQNPSVSSGNTGKVNNPFLVGNSKKYNTDSSCRTNGHRKKPPESEGSKKFYSLKPLNQKKGLHFCSMKPSLPSLTLNGKCKRHHSFAGGGTGDVISVANYPLSHDTQSVKMSFYEPPAYENLTDSIQIHEHNPPPPPSLPTSSLLHQTVTTNHSHHKNRHHQHRHQRMKDCETNLTDKERLSIYRSDSGISNSSYECITPVPAPRQILHKKPHSIKNKSNTPHYMNVSGGSSTTTPTTPSTLSLPPFSFVDSPSNACPLRKHSPKCNCNCNDNGNSCNIHCNNGDNQSNNNAANKDLQHHQQQQQQQIQQSHTHNNHQSSSTPMSHNLQRRKLSSTSLISLERITNTNPFIATTLSSSSGFTSTSGNNSCGNGGGASSSSSSTASRYRQQVLVPKELFPLASPPSPISVPDDASIMFNTRTINSSNDTNTKYSNNMCCYNYLETDQKTSNGGCGKKQKSRGYTVRPVKFPLRKHHSFHFQISQTVAGVKLKKKTNNYVQSGGPLIFKPFISENSAFKPISPAKCNTNGGVPISHMSNSNNNDVTTPRICGTSLKRHMSNVETYDSSRYAVHSSYHSPKKKVISKDGNYSEDEIRIITKYADDGQSSSPNSTVVARYFTDLTNTSINISSTNDDTSPMTDEFDDLTVNSDSEQFSAKSHLRSISYPVRDF